MGERESSRRAVDRVTKRLIDHAAAQGKPITEQAARKQAVEAAHIGDQKQAEGARKRGWKK